MPCIVLVRVPEARNLPVMDRQSESTDAFVEVKLCKQERQSEVCRKSRNPQWEHAEWFQFEIDDDELQDEPLQIKIMDHDTISAHDAIGRVYLPLNPLLASVGALSIDGWFPVYDTLHGMRGEVRVVVKLEVLVDANVYRQSSAGVRFAASASIPRGFRATRIQGFVEELLVNDDPEYQLIENFRTARKTNEERLRLFQRLSGELQRRLGVKVLEARANTVLGYRQCIDLEGETGVVIRAIGTMATLEPLGVSAPPTPPHTCGSATSSVSPSPLKHDQPLVVEPTSVCTGTPIHDFPSSFPEETVKSQSLPNHAVLASTPLNIRPTQMTSLTAWHMSERMAKHAEFPFFTLTSLPAGTLQRIGGACIVRSVKLLDRIDNTDDPETRDAWWRELRHEVLAHAHNWGCNAVIGYEESTALCDELCVLSASGTAVLLQLNEVIFNAAMMMVGEMQPALDSSMVQGVPGSDEKPSNAARPSASCSILHVPYQHTDVPFHTQGSARCGVCGHALVPDVLLSTFEMLPNIAIVGRGCLIQARVCRPKKKATGETNAAVVSSALPFLEFNLHKQLVLKLECIGMNAVFGLRTQISVGETLIIAIATGTAVNLAALPSPRGVQLQPSPSTTEVSHTQGNRVQQQLENNLALHRRTYRNFATSPPEQQVDMTARPGNALPTMSIAGTSVSDEEDIEYTAHHDRLTVGGPRGMAVTEMNEAITEDMVFLLMSAPEPEGVACATTQAVPGVAPTLSPVSEQLCVVQRKPLASLEHATQQLAMMLDGTLQRLMFRARLLAPCSLTALRFEVTLPDDDDVQVTLTGAATSDDQRRQQQARRVTPSDDVNDEMMFQLDAVETVDQPVSTPANTRSGLALRTKRSLRSAPSVVASVFLTSCEVPAGHTVEQSFGYINIVLIRESTSLRDEHGSLSGMLHNFLSETNTVLRSYVAALGGNALVCMRMTICDLSEGRERGQCLLNVSGDAVLVAEIPLSADADTLSRRRSEGTEV